MDFLKELFANSSLTWEQFSAAVAEKGYKVADLSTGNYVAKKKFDDEVLGLNTTITDLNNQIKSRDTDLSNLKADLEKASTAGTNSETTIADLNNRIATLQGDYETAKKDFEAKLASQQYEFAAKEFANTKKFTSAAAKREFEKQLISANLKMKDKSILGAEDFTTKYMETNADSFVVEEAPKPEGEGSAKPIFIQPTPPQPSPDANPFNFNFTGVRAH